MCACVCVCVWACLLVNIADRVLNGFARGATAEKPSETRVAPSVSTSKTLKSSIAWTLRSIRYLSGLESRTYSFTVATASISSSLRTYGKASWIYTGFPSVRKFRPWRHRSRINRSYLAWAPSGFYFWEHEN